MDMVLRRQVSVFLLLRRGRRRQRRSTHRAPAIAFLLLSALPFLCRGCAAASASSVRNDPTTAAADADAAVVGTVGDVPATASATVGSSIDAVDPSRPEGEEDATKAPRAGVGPSRTTAGPSGTTTALSALPPLPPKMTLRLTPRGGKIDLDHDRMRRTYHRHSSGNRGVGVGVGRGGGRVDYGDRHPYDVRYDRHGEQEEEEAERRRRRRRRRRQLQTRDDWLASQESDPYAPIRIHVNTDYLDLTVSELSSSSESSESSSYWSWLGNNDDNDNDDDDNNNDDPSNDPAYVETILQKVNFLKDEVFPQAVARWSELLRVYPAERITIDKEGDCPGYGMAVGYDLIIFAFADCGGGDGGTTRPPKKGGGGGNRMASGKSCQSDEYDRPVAGFTGICLSTFDLTDPRSRREVHETVMHEFVHVLGFYSKDFAYYRNPMTGLARTPVREERTVTCSDGIRRAVVLPGEDTVRGFVDRNGAYRYEITTETVRNVVRNQFDCEDLTGAWLENRQGGGGGTESNDDCFGSHWDFRLFSTEFMTATATSTAQYLSPLTLALLEDTGWYRANYEYASMSPFGHLAGCDFVKEDCIVDGQVPSYSAGSFCTIATSALGCDHSHVNVAHCSQMKYKKELPFAYQYFSDPTVGGKMEELDYCPVYGTTKFFSGLDESGSGGKEDADFFEIDCTDPTLQKAAFAFGVESYGEDGRCFETDYDRPLCLRTYCSEERHAVQVLFGNTMVTCMSDGQKIQIPGLEGHSFTCPRLAQMCPDLICRANCSGRGVCDTSLPDPECVCNDPTDASPICANSPVMKDLEQITDQS